MQELTKPEEMFLPSEPDSVRQLLLALGEWGLAEVKGASTSTLDQLEDRARNAYSDAASVA